MAKISLQKSIVQRVELCANQDTDDSQDTTLNFETYFSDDNRSEFAIKFQLTITTPESKLDLAYASFFKSDKEIDENEYDNHFYNVNAPAIAYPFLRAYVSNLFLNSGYAPIMIPTINFMQLEKDRRANLENKKD